MLKSRVLSLTLKLSWVNEMGLELKTNHKALHPGYWDERSSPPPHTHTQAISPNISRRRSLCSRSLYTHSASSSDASFLMAGVHTCPRICSRCNSERVTGSIAAVACISYPLHRLSNTFEEVLNTTQSPARPGQLTLQAVPPGSEVWMYPPAVYGYH